MATSAHTAVAVSEFVPAQSRLRSWRVIMVARTRYPLPLPATLKPKFEALAAAGIEVRVLASAAPGSPASDTVFRLARAHSSPIVDRLLFFSLLPIRIARELRRFDPDAVFVQGVFEATCVLLARTITLSRVKVILDVEGDWRAATRLYGSPLRRLLDPVGDLLGWLVIRRADAVRTLGPYTTRLVQALGVQPIAVFPTYTDSAAFHAKPPVALPREPRALFVGVLERSKNIDVLLQAWKAAAPRVPTAILHIVGNGARASAVAALASELPAQVQWTATTLTSTEIAALLDRSTLLVLPSQSEGMGRVVIEAFARGRPVIGTGIGGIADLVRDEENGLLVTDPDDVAQLAEALVRLLSDPLLAERLCAATSDTASQWLLDPDEYAARFRAMVEDAYASS